MGIKTLLKTINFLQYFIWGSWLVTMATYFFSLGWSSNQFGYIYSAIGISAIGFPSFFGFLCDKFLRVKHVFRFLHLISGIVMLFIPLIDSTTSFYIVFQIYMILYMATLPMLISYCYQVLNENTIDVKIHYPKIRVWGTLGFICALWLISLTENEASVNQFYISALASFVLFGFTFLMPHVQKNKVEKKTNILKMFGLDVLKLVFNKKLIPFYFLAYFFGVALIVANGYTDAFIHQISSKFTSDSFIIKYPAILVSIAQISELVFLLLMPYFLKRISNEKLLILSFVVWSFKFGFLYLAGTHNLLMPIILSSVCYGLAFDFFIVPGSIYLDENISKDNRIGAQGLLVMLVNGFGSLSGSFFSGIIITSYFTIQNDIIWSQVWLFFFLMILVVLSFYFMLRFFINKKTG